LKRKATNQNYIVGKGPISARAAIEAVAAKEAQKRPKKQKQQVILQVSSDEDSDSDSDNEPDTEYNTLQPELANWDNGQSNWELLRNLFEMSDSYIAFDLSILQ
jgi:hypothetical protein